ncbi:hypothetical protein PJO47_29290, partial [Mycobacterium kansasii]
THSLCAIDCARKMGNFSHTGYRTMKSVSNILFLFDPVFHFFLQGVFKIKYRIKGASVGAQK